MKKKLLSVIMVFAMLFATAQGILGTVVYADRNPLTADVVNSADENGVFWIEENQYSLYNSHTTSGSGASEVPALVSGTVATTDQKGKLSGGDAYYDMFTGRHSEAQYTINIESEGTYKIWYHGSDPTNAKSDKTHIYVNNTEVSITKIGGTASDVMLHSSGGRTLSCSWFVGEVTLSEGQSTIKYYNEDKATTSFDQKRYACVLDCFVLAPSNYRWTPVSIDTTPVMSSVTQFNGNALKIEETAWNNFIGGTNEAPPLATVQGAGSSGLSKLSDGDAHYIWFASWQYDAAFKINNTAGAGTYKLWYHGTAMDADYMSPLKLYINGTEVSMTKVTENENILINSRAFECAWYAADITLTAGENTIRYYTTNKLYNNDTACHVLFDCFVLSPIYYWWDSPSISTMPSSMVNFDGSVLKVEETEYSSFNNHQNSNLMGTMSSATEADKAKLSGGDAHQVWANTWYYDETFNVYNTGVTGVYRLWYHGTVLNDNGMSVLTLKVNGSSVTMSRVTKNESITLESGKTFKCAWYAADVTLTAGENTINYYTTNTTYNGDTACRVLFDCFVLSPSNYDWISPTVSTMPELTKFKVTGFDISGTASAGNTVSATATVLRNSGGTGDVNLIVAVYDSSYNLVGFSKQTASLANAQQADFSTSVSIGAGMSASHAKAFLWEDLANIIPIRKDIELD